VNTSEELIYKMKNNKQGLIYFLVGSETDEESQSIIRFCENNYHKVNELKTGPSYNLRYYLPK
jgi:hypothetical protein